MTRDELAALEPGNWRVWAQGGEVFMALAGMLGEDVAVVRVNMTIAQALDAARALQEAAGIEWATA
jgi:hypothetical protein